jgi:hypothetical protein
MSGGLSVKMQEKYVNKFFNLLKNTDLFTHGLFNDCITEEQRKIFNDENNEIYELIFTNTDYQYETLSNDLLLEKRLKFLNFDRIDIIAEMFMKLLKDEKSNLYEIHQTLSIHFDCYEDYIINVKEYNEIIETCQVFLHSFTFLDGYCIHA